MTGPIHLVGVGGAGMSALARLALLRGERVSGTDRDDSPVLRALAAFGGDVHAGHSADALPPDAAVVVVSTAVPADNPEVVAARARGIPVRHRVELLARLMAGHRGLAVAGAHGKSTTSAMLAMALGDVSCCIGATVPGGEGTGARWGDGPWFVAEADESDRSLLRLRPEAAILLNVDHDHHATFASLAEVEEVFRSFVALLPADGCLVVGPDPGARRVAADAPCPVLRVGAEPDADVRIVAGPDGARLVAGGDDVALALAVPGRHNIENAACAVALAWRCGTPLAEAAGALSRFRGVGRRFEVRGEVGGVAVVDDYAHHPAEVAATLAAAREWVGAGRVIAIFQPHLVSRTRALGVELGRALGAADRVVVTDVYVAREEADPTVSGAAVADAVPAPAAARFVADLSAAGRVAVAESRPGDMIITMGAGDVTRLGQELVDALGTRYRDGGDSDDPDPDRDP